MFKALNGLAPLGPIPSQLLMTIALISLLYMYMCGANDKVAAGETDHSRLPVHEPGTLLLFSLCIVDVYERFKFFL